MSVQSARRQLVIQMLADADVTGIGSRAFGKALAHIDRTMLNVISAPPTPNLTYAPPNNQSRKPAREVKTQQ